MMTIREKAEYIIRDIKREQGTNPVTIFRNIAAKDYVSMHGPEHHILDGASLLVAYKNAGGNIDIDVALDKLMSEGLRMPGAMCGTWGDHMQYTSAAIGELGTINGPRCCKRDAMIAFKNGIEYVNSHYGMALQYEHRQCEYSDMNAQCIGERCPFFI